MCFIYLIAFIFCIIKLQVLQHLINFLCLLVLLISLFNFNSCIHFIKNHLIFWIIAIPFYLAILYLFLDWINKSYFRILFFIIIIFLFWNWFFITLLIWFIRIILIWCSCFLFMIWLHLLFFLLFVLFLFVFRSQFFFYFPLINGSYFFILIFH